MSASVTLNVRVIAHPDRPGIAAVFVGEQQLFASDAEVVLEVTATSKVPIDLQCGEPILGVAYRVP